MAGADSVAVEVANDPDGVLGRGGTRGERRGATGLLPVIEGKEIRGQRHGEGGENPPYQGWHGGCDVFEIT